MAGSNNEGGVLDVHVEEVWKRLEAEPNSVLIDVRTQAEWSFVGIPDLSPLGKQAMLTEWQTFPGGQPNPDFTAQVKSALDAAGIDRDANLFFICRSGSRSRAAASAMAAAGYSACHNVADGFEGPPDSDRHRGTVAGWKAAGLPWVQK